MLPALSELYEIVVVIEDDAPVPQIPVPVQWVRLSQYEINQEQYSSVPHLYHLGNNPDHLYMFPWLFKRPGLVVQHDLSMNYYFRLLTDEWRNELLSTEVWRFCHGRVGSLMAKEEARRPEDASLFEVVAHFAKGLVAHSFSSYLSLRSVREDGRVWRIPHFVSDETLEFPVEEEGRLWRRKWGISSDAFIFMSVGYVARAKLLDRALGAFKALAAKHPEAVFVVAGSLRPEEFDVQGFIDAQKMKSQVILTDYLPAEDFLPAISAADVVVNLRYPCRGETSGTLLNALGLGKAVVVTREGTFAEFPDEVVCKVHVSEIKHALPKIMEGLIADPEERAALGKRAQEYVRNENRTSAVVHQYREAIQAVAKVSDNAIPAPFPHKPVFSFLSRNSHRTRLLDTMGESLPPSNPTETGYCGLAWWLEPNMPCGKSSEALVAEGIPEYWFPLLVRLYGFGSVGPPDPGEHPRGGLLCLPYLDWEKGGYDALARMYQCLPHNGFLTICLWTATADFRGGLTAKAVEDRLWLSGFEPINSKSGPGLLAWSELTGLRFSEEVSAWEEILILARKASRPRRWAEIGRLDETRQTGFRERAPERAQGRGQFPR